MSQPTDGPDTPFDMPAKGEVGTLFRERLEQAMRDAGLNQSELARRARVDRSTLSQFLSGDGPRVPRADTAAALARVLQVSLDWLLGLSRDRRALATILRESMEIAPSSQTPADERLAGWQREAAGTKIRYVPTSLPDLMKTDAVIAFEYADMVGRTPRQASVQSEERLAYSRRPETDFEICMSRQAIEGFARGEGIWRDLPAADRRHQLIRMSELIDELYPSLRLYLYDARTHYAAPYTVFGPYRAAVFVGQMFLVFNTEEHIRGLTRHFDGLIRAATVQAHEAAAFTQGLLRHTG